MTIYYNSKSQSLKKLNLKQRQTIKEILSDTLELKKRQSNLKYRIEHAGQTLPIFSFQYGVGGERGTERVLYTFWKESCIVLDYVGEHDYHKATAMKPALMRGFFSELKQGACELVELEELERNFVFEQQELIALASNQQWVPVSVDHAGRYVIPSKRQQEVAFSEHYPLIIEGVAGSGKTLVLSLCCQALSDLQLSNADLRTQKPEFFYAYPGNSEMLGEKMQKEWSKTWLTGAQSLTEWDFKVTVIDELLPEALRGRALMELELDFNILFDSEKKLLELESKNSQKFFTRLGLKKAWSTIFQSQLSAKIVLEYLMTLAVFKASLGSQLVPLKDLLSSRGGFSPDLFKAIEDIYIQVASRTHFQKMILALQEERVLKDIVVVDEAQNVSFVALAYIATHTVDKRVIFSGDREQSADWNSITSLELIEIFFNRSQSVYYKEFFNKNYRCPENIWQYAQERVLAAKAQFFGYDSRSSCQLSQESAIAASVEPTEISNVQYVNVSQKNLKSLEAFFENIPVMSPDCFVITSDIARFEEFSRDYLKGKNFIILTPEQVAGLEVKTVVAFNPLNWGNIRKLEMNNKVKTRSKVLNAVEQEAYEQFNHLYVILTRSTEQALIIESSSKVHCDLKNSLFEGLLPPIVDPVVYGNFDPEVLLDIYIKMGREKTPEGKDFLQRYGKYFEEALLTSTLTPALSVKQRGPSLLRPQAIGEIIQVLSSSEGRWESLQGLSSELIARILFEPYGKKIKKSLWERLRMQDGESLSRLTPEKTAWQKFLTSAPVAAYIREDFYEILMPGLDKSIGQWLLDAQKSDEPFQKIKSMLVIKSIETCQNSSVAHSLLSQLIEDCDLKLYENPASQRIVLPELESAVRPLILSDKRSANGRDSEIISTISGILKGSVENKEKGLTTELIKVIIDHPMVTATSSEKFMLITTAFATYYLCNRNTDIKDIEEKSEKIIKSICVLKPNFWINLNETKYSFLQKFTQNNRLLLDLLSEPKDGLFIDPSLLRRAFAYIFKSPSLIAEVAGKTEVTEREESDIYQKIWVGIALLLEKYLYAIADQKNYQAPKIILLSRIHKDCCIKMTSLFVNTILSVDSYWERQTIEENVAAIHCFLTEAQEKKYSTSIIEALRRKLSALTSSESHPIFDGKCYKYAELHIDSLSDLSEHNQTNKKRF